jgi:hypothetical protein
MQDYFGYIAQSMYHMYLNQQVFQTHVNNEFANINNENSTLKGNLTRMEDWQHNLQTNWVNKYGNWVDNTGDMDFDLESGNIDMEMADDPSVRAQEEEEEEEEETEMVGEQKVAPTDPPDQAWRSIFLLLLLIFLRIFFVLLSFNFGFIILWDESYALITMAMYVLTCLSFAYLCNALNICAWLFELSLLYYCYHFLFKTL